MSLSAYNRIQVAGVNLRGGGVKDEVERSAVVVGNRLSAGEFCVVAIFYAAVFVSKQMHIAVALR